MRLWNINASIKFWLTRFWFYSFKSHKEIFGH